MSTTRKKELDVDIIGSGEPLTREEEKKISDTIKMLKKNKKQATQKKVSTRRKAVA